MTIDIYEETARAIRADLLDFAFTNHIDILLAADIGSHSKGYATIQSDFDIGFIYRRQSISDYIRIDPPASKLKALHNVEVITDFTVNSKLTVKLEIQGWDIIEAAHLLWNSNPTLMEIVISSEQYAGIEFALQLQALLPKVLCKKTLAYHYWHKTHNQLKDIMARDSEEIPHKKYIHTMQALACVLFLLEFNNRLPTNIYGLFGAVMHRIYEPILREITRMILDRKISGNSNKSGPTDPILNHWIQEKLESIRSRIDALETREVPPGVLNDLIQKTLADTQPLNPRRVSPKAVPESLSAVLLKAHNLEGF